MHIKIIEERKNNKLNSTFYVDGSDDLYAKFDIDDSIFADILAPNIIKIWDKKNSDYYEIRESKGWFSKSKIIKNKKFSNKFKKVGKYYDICGKRYGYFIHNNPKHGIPDIISLTNMKEQVALIKREVTKLNYIHKGVFDIFGKENSVIIYDVSFDPNITSSILDLFIIVVYNATIIYNSFTPGGLHYEYGLRVIFPEEHKEHLQWIPSDETSD